jgi:uncharacterized protein (TIGR02147 family)
MAGRSGGPHNEPSSSATRGRSGIDVFRYLDVTAYLRDVYQASKAEGRGFSFRAFSRRAGLRSPNHLTRVIDGERPLTSEMAVRYAAALGLSGDAARYFCDLAAFGRARTHEERNAAYQRLAGYRHYRRAQHLEVAQGEYHANWYLPAIRELVSAADFRPDPEWIARRLIPPIRPSMARDALQTLLALGLIREDEQGRLVQSEAVVTTGAESRGLHLRNYHRAMMAQAADSLENVPAALRDISSLTMCTTEAGLLDLKDRIRRFRQELIALAAQQTGGDRVVQLNVQLFPLTTAADEDDEAR